MKPQSTSEESPLQLSLFPPTKAFSAVPVELHVITNQLAPGSTVVAAEDIHFSGDGTMISAGTQGKIETAGSYACNVHFEGYPENRSVLCLWSMLLAYGNQRERKRKVKALPKG